MRKFTTPTTTPTTNKLEMYDIVHAIASGDA
jgi:hypothetical protein